MQFKRLVVYLTGIAAILIAVSIITTVSGFYVYAWYDFGQNTGVNTVTVSGITNTYGNGSNLLVNMTMSVTYPKAVTESWRLFVMNATFFVTLDPIISEFGLEVVNPIFQSNSECDNLYVELIYNDSGLGRSSVTPIPPYRSKISIPVQFAQWPPFSQSDTSHVLDFTDRFEIYPTLSLWFQWTSYNYTVNQGDIFSQHLLNFGYLSVDFNLTNYNPIKIYRFNSPLTLWLIYGCTIPTIIAVPIYLIRKRSRDKTASLSRASS